MHIVGHAQQHSKAYSSAPAGVDAARRDDDKSRFDENVTNAALLQSLTCAAAKLYKVRVQLNPAEVEHTAFVVRGVCDAPTRRYPMPCS
eukprot:8712105-Pyramimonas_sp.AAC.2